MLVIIDEHLVSEVNDVNEVNVLAGMMRVRGGGTSFVTCSRAVEEEQEYESRVEKRKREEKEGKIECSEYICRNRKVIEHGPLGSTYVVSCSYVCACWLVPFTRALL